MAKQWRQMPGMNERQEPRQTEHTAPGNTIQTKPRMRNKTHDITRGKKPAKTKPGTAERTTSNIRTRAGQTRRESWYGNTEEGHRGHKPGQQDKKQGRSTWKQDRD